MIGDASKPDLSPPKRLKYAHGGGPRLTSPIQYAESSLGQYMRQAENMPGSPFFLDLEKRPERDKARFWAMWTRQQEARSWGIAGQFDEGGA
jgi:hypothetical protein